MTQDNQQDEGFTESLGEHDYSTKFTLVGRSQAKFYEDTVTGKSGNVEVIEIAAMSTPGAVADLGSDAENKALAGFDTIFSPYTTASGHPELPHFEIPTNLTDPNSYTLDPFNPNNIFTTGTPAAPRSQAENNAIFQASGHNIQMANTWTTEDIAGASSGDVDFAKDLYDNAEFEYDNVRSIGLRSPIVLTGWGFDVNGGPVPVDTGDSTAFASGAFRDPSIWKSGPLDVRWDDERKVWAAGSVTKHYLVKMTNTYNPSHFSYEVQRSDSRSQYSRDTLSARAFSETAPIHDPEFEAYTANDLNTGAFERLDFTGLEFPHYEAFIIRETKDEVGSAYYNLFTDDCNDCGHITNSGCGTQHGRDSKDKKILIENPLRQSMNVGDLAFTVKTGRSADVNTGSFVAGSGTGAAGQLETDADGNISGVVINGGTDYVHNGFAIVNGDICINPTLTFANDSLDTITVTPTGGFPSNQIYSLSIFPNNSRAETEKLDIHWIVQAEFKSQQVTTHVEADGGILQTCTTMLQTQGFKSCEHCGEDLTLINNTI